MQCMKRTLALYDPRTDPLSPIRLSWNLPSWTRLQPLERRQGESASVSMLVARFGLGKEGKEKNTPFGRCGLHSAACFLETWPHTLWSSRRVTMLCVAAVRKFDPSVCLCVDNVGYYNKDVLQIMPIFC